MSRTIDSFSSSRLSAFEMGDSVEQVNLILPVLLFGLFLLISCSDYPRYLVVSMVLSRESTTIIPTRIGERV